MALTVSEIAERIAKGGAAKRALIRRLRHWTKEGLLKPIGKRHPGTGSHREYYDWALEDAVLLNAMADLGLQVDIMRTALAVASQIRSDWGKAKTKEEGPPFLQIDLASPLQREVVPRLHFGNFIGFGFETAIVFDLTRLLAPFKTEGE
jgi:DNA-binding transcriptional MerR regulator